jgi:predicted transcriptional regulator
MQNNSKFRININKLNNKFNHSKNKFKFKNRKTEKLKNKYIQILKNKKSIMHQIKEKI